MARTKQTYTSIRDFRSAASLAQLNLPALDADGREQALAGLEAMAQRLQQPQPRLRAMGIIDQLRAEALALPQTELPPELQAEAALEIADAIDGSGEPEPSADFLAALAADEQQLAEGLAQLDAMTEEALAPSDPLAAIEAAEDELEQQKRDALKRHTADGSRSRAKRQTAAKRDAAKAKRSEQAAAKRQAKGESSSAGTRALRAARAAKPEAAPADGQKRCAGLPTRGVAPHEAPLDRFGSNARMPDGLSRVCRDCNATYARLVKESAA